MSQNAPGKSNNDTPSLGLSCFDLLKFLVENAKERTHWCQFYNHAHGTNRDCQQGHNVGVVECSQNSHFLTEVPVLRERGERGRGGGVNITCNSLCISRYR